MTPVFSMTVEERLALPGIPDVVLAGSVSSGDCHVGDRLVLEGRDVTIEVHCTGIELLNWGRRPDWVSIRVSRVDLVDVENIDTVRSAELSGEFEYP